jgi:hypothetical protein
MGIIMGYFDALTGNGFKKLNDGKTAYYPNGIFGKGYIINDDACHRIQKFLKYYFILYFISLGLYGGFIGAFAIHSMAVSILGFLLLMIISLIAYYSFYLLKIKPILINPAAAGVKLTVKENLQNMSLRMGYNAIIFQIVSASFLVIMAFILLLVSSHKLISIIGLVFFGLGLIQGIYMYRVVHKSENKHARASQE